MHYELHTFYQHRLNLQFYVLYIFPFTKKKKYTVLNEVKRIHVQGKL